VKHIPKDNFTDDELKIVFEPFGEIKSAIVLRDQNGASKGFGFVCFTKPEYAEDACKQLKDKVVWQDKDLPPIYLNFAMEKKRKIGTFVQKKRGDV